MIYANDQWLQMPTKDLYDTQMMAMALNAAKDMYEKGQQQIKDFTTTYGDFITPIAKDQDYYNKNVLDPVRNTINAIYEAGGDPLRSPEARALIARTINKVNTGDVQKLKQSAENANEFLKAKAKLELQGLYNPMYAKYDHPDISTYSTLGPEGSGIWDKMSPTPYQNMADFSKSYFEGIKPITRSASRNGINYTKSEITEDDLRNIANAHFNDLVNTPQGQLMYKKFLDDFDQNEEAAKNAFNDSVVAGNLKRLFYQDDYNDNWYKNQDLALKRMQLEIARQNAATRAAALAKKGKSTNSKNGSSTEKGDFNYQDFLIGTTASHILGQTSYGLKIGVGGVSDYNPDKVSGFMGAAQKEIAQQSYGVNWKQYRPFNGQVSRSFGGFNFSDWLNKDVQYFDAGPSQLDNDQLHSANLDFLSKLSVPSSPETFAKQTQRASFGPNNSYVLMNLNADKNRIYSADEIALTSEGVDRPNDVPNAIEKTKKLRKQFEINFSEGRTLMQSAGYVVGRVGKDGAHHIFQKVRIVNATHLKADDSDSESNETSRYKYNDVYGKDEYVYYDMGIDTYGNPNYENDRMENMYPIVTDQSLGSNRSATKHLGFGNTDVKSNSTAPWLNRDDELLDDIINYEDNLNIFF